MTDIKELNTFKRNAVLADTVGQQARQIELLRSELRVLRQEIEAAVAAIREAANGHPSPKVNKALLPLTSARAKAGEALERTKA